MTDPRDYKTACNLLVHVVRIQWSTSRPLPWNRPFVTSVVVA